MIGESLFISNNYKLNRVVTGEIGYVCKTKTVI